MFQTLQYNALTPSLTETVTRQTNKWLSDLQTWTICHYISLMARQYWQLHYTTQIQEHVILNTETIYLVPPALHYFANLFWVHRKVILMSFLLYREC